MVRPTLDSRGVFEYKRRYPKELSHLYAPSARWKRSLGTRDPAEALKRFPSVHLECEGYFAVLLAVHHEGFQLDARDAQQLAARWFKAELAELEKTADYTAFLVVTASASLGAESGDTAASVEWGTIQDAWSGGDYGSQVAPFIRQALEVHNYPVVAEGTAPYRVLADAFWPMLCDLSALCMARLASGGRYISPPTIVPHAPLLLEAKKAGMPLSHLFDRWADDKLSTDAKATKTVDEFRAVIRRFQELYGDVEVRSITRSVISDFRTALGKLPTKGEGIRALSAPQAIAKAQAEGLPTAGLLTVRKHLAALSAVLNFGVQRLEVMVEEPVSASGVLKTLAKAASRQETRTREDKIFSKTELSVIFSSALFKGQWSPPRSDFGMALYWLPLLMAYTGARREELAQLLVDDVGRCADTGIWFIALRPDADKTVKSASSRRRVPLHADLLALGFVRYVEALPAGGRVFPALVAHATNGLGHSVGVAWGRYLRKTLGLQFEADPCHGFRHTFKTLCREAGIETAVQDWITGHSTAGVGAMYGATPLSRMAEELRKYPSIARNAGLL